MAWLERRAKQAMLCVFYSLHEYWIGLCESM